PTVTTTADGRQSSGSPTKRPQERKRSTPRKLDRFAGIAKENDLASPAPELTPLSRDADERTLRVEIQTKDPNIRIIWFARHETKPGPQNLKGI
ncbi:MAG: hypothetical protein ACRD8U_01830, partial [Pyrinomonadaceae bacterium]